MIVDLPQTVESFVQQSIAEGRYASAEEALTELVEFFRSHEPNTTAMKAEVQVGLEQEAAGLYTEIDIEDVLCRGRQRINAEQPR
jgi:putative addiction module CopG family antidote